MTEYPAMVYKNTRNNSFIANCIVKNIFGFGKTEEEAINNLKGFLSGPCGEEINIKTYYGLAM